MAKTRGSNAMVRKLPKGITEAKENGEITNAEQRMRDGEDELIRGWSSRRQFQVEMRGRVVQRSRPTPNGPLRHWMLEQGTCSSLITRRCS